MRHLFKRSDPARSTPPDDPTQLACPHARGCEMFELLRAAGTLKTWQIRYCGGNYHSCARHEMSAQGKPVPPNLLPSGQLLRFAGGDR